MHAHTHCIHTCKYIHMHTHTLHTYTVPSGHILTREELQVLGALLSRFSDEKLKSIQLSLQEEQEIRDISREEVEKSLRQSGLASMADGLKDDIEKGIVWDDNTTPLYIVGIHIYYIELIMRFLRPHRINYLFELTWPQNSRIALVDGW